MRKERGRRVNHPLAPLAGRLPAGWRIPTQRRRRRSVVATKGSVGPSTKVTIGVMSRGEGSNECQSPRLLGFHHSALRLASMFFTYILYSPSLDRYYIGQTHDLSARFRHHAMGSTPETSKASDWTVVFLQSFPTRAESVRMERQIKGSKSRKSILRYIRDPRNELAAPRPTSDWWRPDHSSHGFAMFVAASHARNESAWTT